jgi:hypothetical protein
MKSYSIILLVIGIICLVSSGGRADFSCTFENDHQTAIVGGSVEFRVLINNNGTQSFFLNGNTLDLSGNWTNILILNDDQFYSSVPYPLTQGSSWEGNIFTISIGDMAKPGTYVGWYYLFGGANEDADLLLASQNFSITISPKPIPVDFDSDDDVDLGDFSILVYYWMDNNCTLENKYCFGTDADANGKVDFEDFVKFASHWLEGVDVVK